jgi:hypothetical protein
MSTVFVLQNQRKHFLNKQKTWVSGRDARVIFNTPHKDEAINQMFEVSSKDYTQRLTVLSCELNEKRLPIIEDEHLPDLEDFAPAADNLTPELSDAHHQSTANDAAI